LRHFVFPLKYFLSLLFTLVWPDAASVPPGE
jgi:hypothetical protein